MAEKDWRGAAERKVRLLKDLAVEGSVRCSYAPGCFDPEVWPTSRCDCKYVDPPMNSQEQTGCCEMRAAYRVLAGEDDKAIEPQREGDYL